MDKAPKCRYHVGTDLEPYMQHSEPRAGTTGRLIPTRIALRCPVIQNGLRCPYVDQAEAICDPKQETRRWQEKDWMEL